MFGWFRRRPKRQPEDVGRALQLQRLQMGQIKLDLLRAMASDRDTAHLAVAGLFPALAKSVSPPQQDDRMQALFLEVLRGSLNRNPTTDLLQTLTALKALARDGRDVLDELQGHAPRGDETALDRVLNSGFGEALGQTAGAVVGQVVAGAMQRQAQTTTPAVHVATLASPPPPQQAPAAEVTPAQVLQVLQTQEPEAAAQTALEWAQRSPMLAQVLRQLLSIPEAGLPYALQAYAHGEWGPVALWLLEKGDWRDAFLRHLRDLASTPHQAAPANSNGHSGGF